MEKYAAGRVFAQPAPRGLVASNGLQSKLLSNSACSYVVVGAGAFFLAVAMGMAYNYIKDYLYRS
jgi:hypothetical protein